MKNVILLSSAGLVTAATSLGITVALLVSSPELIVRLSTVTWILGLGSVGLFFVGLAFPKDGGQK